MYILKEQGGGRVSVKKRGMLRGKERVRREGRRVKQRRRELKAYFSSDQHLLRQ